MTRITDIVDNRAAEGFVAEHGLSLLIEHGDGCILFDTGAGAALQPNAAKLGIDLGGVTRIVLSHSHNVSGGYLSGRIERTGEFLRQLKLDQLVLLHCTGESAGAKLKEMLSCPVVWGSAGTSA